MTVSRVSAESTKALLSHSIVGDEVEPIDREAWNYLIESTDVHLSSILVNRQTLQDIAQWSSSGDLPNSGGITREALREAFTFVGTHKTGPNLMYEAWCETLANMEREMWENLVHMIRGLVSTGA